MNVSSRVRREIRFPHAIGSVLALGLAVALVPRDGAPILIAFYVAAAALAVAVAFRRISRFRLLPIVTLLAFAFGAYGYVTDGIGVTAIAPVVIGLLVLGRYARIRRSSA